MDSETPVCSFGSDPSVLGAQDGQELQAAIISRLPAKIDIGPVYNVDPARRRAYTGQQLPIQMDPASAWSTHTHRPVVVCVTLWLIAVRLWLIAYGCELSEAVFQ